MLDHSLADIGDLLGLSLTAISSALHRGRTQLHELNTALGNPRGLKQISIGRNRALRFTLQARDWDPLRSLLAAEVHIDQTSRAVLRGKLAASTFFTRYDASSEMAPRRGVGGRP